MCMARKKQTKPVNLLEVITCINSKRIKYHDRHQITLKGILTDWFEFDKKFNDGKVVKHTQRGISKVISNLFS